jgi:NADPH:quinone reductase-like Zn-dependent oxidoreductase
MKAIVYTKYGLPSEVLELKEVDKPTPKNNEVLVKIFASSINDGDKSLIRGSPFIARFSSGLLKPKHKIPGGDIAGQVEAVGGNVKQFKPGDEVFGDLGASGFGAYAEYVAAPENALALKPVNLTYEQAAAFPQYALVALQGLRDKGQIQPGQKVLINGASGGVGTFAVQIAKSFGAEVTGVCSTRNLELVRSIGADHVIDYTREDFAKRERRYDLILDSVANRPLSDYRSALSPEGSYVAVAFNLNALMMGPLTSKKGGQKVTQLSHEPSVDDLVYMKGLVEAGKVRPIIDRSFPLSKIAEAFRYFVEGHPSGKVVITMGNDANEQVNDRG